MRPITVRAVAKRSFPGFNNDEFEAVYEVGDKDDPVKVLAIARDVVEAAHEQARQKRAEQAAEEELQRWADRFRAEWRRFAQAVGLPYAIHNLLLTCLLNVNAEEDGWRDAFSDDEGNLVDCRTWVMYSLEGRKKEILWLPGLGRKRYQVLLQARDEFMAEHPPY